MTSEEGFLDLDRQLQPHLPSVGETGSPLTQGDAPVTVSGSPSLPPSSQQKAASTHPSWERFDDDIDRQNDLGVVGFSPQAGFPGVAPTANPAANGAGHAQNGGDRTGARDTKSPAQTLGEQPVFYNCQSGQTVVVPNGAIFPAEAGGSGAVIATQYIQDRWRERERPLRARQMKILKILSVVAAVLFFPTGIPAAYYAWQTRKEFDRGILRGNIDRAQKLARRTEHLIILSAVLLVLVAVLTFALVERAAHGYTVDHSYVAHSSLRN